jgi:hypothetical protein
VTALLQAPSTLNLTPPPRKSAAPPAPPPAPPLPPPPPAHQVGFSRPAELPAALQEKLFCSSKAGWATLRCKQYEDILASPVATKPVVPLEFELEMNPAGPGDGPEFRRAWSKFRLIWAILLPVQPFDGAVGALGDLNVVQAGALSSPHAACCATL